MDIISSFLYIWFQIIEEEASKRIEMLVKKRVEEELEKRRDEIEQEVKRRVEEAKAEMEREMMLELERRREQIREEERRREVGARFQRFSYQLGAFMPLTLQAFTKNNFKLFTFLFHS